MYDKLVTNANAIDTKGSNTSELVSKRQYDSKKQNLDRKIEDSDKKIPNTNGLVKKIDYHKKIRD